MNGCLCLATIPCCCVRIVCYKPCWWNCASCSNISNFPWRSRVYAFACLSSYCVGVSCLVLVSHCRHITFYILTLDSFHSLYTTNNAVFFFLLCLAWMVARLDENYCMCMENHINSFKLTLECSLRFVTLSVDFKFYNFFLLPICVFYSKFGSKVKNRAAKMKLWKPLIFFCSWILHFSLV